jgi:hypothetical protein
VIGRLFQPKSKLTPNCTAKYYKVNFMILNDNSRFEHFLKVCCLLPTKNTCLHAILLLSHIKLLIIHKERVMQKIKLTADDIDVGQPLPWSVYGSSDELLLDNGRIVTTKKQKNILVSRGLYRKPTKLEHKQQEALNKKKTVFTLDSPFKVLDVIKIP